LAYGLTPELLLGALEEARSRAPDTGTPDRR